MIDLRPYLPQSTGNEPLRFRYVNQGSDWRLGGPLGLLFGGIQRASMVYSQYQAWWVIKAQYGESYVGIQWPPLFTLRIPRGDRFFRIRIGWRYDHNVGDGKNLPREPVHDPPGAYFLDWWITRNAKE